MMRSGGRDIRARNGGKKGEVTYSVYICVMEFVRRSLTTCEEKHRKLLKYLTIAAMALVSLPFPFAHNNLLL